MKLKNFIRREDGSYSVEAVLVFPILLWVLVATFVFWDVFKLRNNAVTATYTLADMISRQTEEIDPAFLSGLDDVFTAVVGAEVPMDMRVTVMRMDVGSDPVTDPTELALVWSHGTDGMPQYVDPVSLEDNIPILAVGATLILVETVVTWTPPLASILPETELGSRVFASPRFVPQILFDDGTVDGADLPDDGD